MSPNRLVSGPAAERIRSFSFEHSSTPRGTGAPTTAIHLHDEIERRSQVLAEQYRAAAEDEGFNQGMLAANEQMMAAKDLLAETLNAFNASTTNSIGELAEASVQVGIAIAEAIIGHQLAIDPTIVTIPIEAAMHELEGDGDAIVRLNPIDVAELASRTEAPLAPGIRIVEDHTVARGNCRVESPLRVAIDGIYERLDSIKAAVGEPASHLPNQATAP